MIPRRARPRITSVTSITPIGPVTTAQPCPTVRWRDDDTGRALPVGLAAVPPTRGSTAAPSSFRMTSGPTIAASAAKLPTLRRAVAALLFAPLLAHAAPQADTVPAGTAATANAPAPAAQEPASSPRRPGETTTGRAPAPAQPAPATTPAAAAPATAPLPGDAAKTTTATTPEAGAAPTHAAPAAASTPSSTTTAPNTAPSTRPAPQVTLASPPSPAGGLLQTIMALMLVLGLLAGLAWLLKRYGPKAGAAGANLRVVGALNIGGRERIMVVEVGDQWIVVGAAPGRVNALHTMPRQEGALAPLPAGGATPANSFSDWLKNTIDKRNAT